MMPQSWPLYATPPPIDDSPPQVYAIIGWHPPDLPGHPMRAHMVALGAGHQRVDDPGPVWTSPEAARQSLAGEPPPAIG